MLILARDKDAREELMDLFKQKQVKKLYLAWVQGAPNPPTGALRFPIRDLGARSVVHPGGQSAETRYRTEARLGPCARLCVDLQTGRHNQIRVHFAHIGHPLVGERKYARGRDATVRHKRAALHASRVEFTCPFSAVAIRLDAPIPQDLTNLEARLRER